MVFTLPEPIAALAYQNKEEVYGILFRATAETLRTIAGHPKHLGAEIGFLAILHTWGQNLLHHPHLHCVVTGGGISPHADRWISCRPGFFLPVRVLARLSRRLFLQYLQKAFEAGQLQLFSSLESLRDPHVFRHRLAPARQAEWVVYATPPFAGLESVLAYLGRYTHRVAISNHRLIEMENGRVHFRWKDYRHPNHEKMMTLTAEEFIRRFLLHVLPSGFQRIRYYGFLGNRYRRQKLAHCRQLLGAPTPLPQPGLPLDYRDRYEKLHRSFATRLSSLPSRSHGAGPNPARFLARPAAPRHPMRTTPFNPCNLVPAGLFPALRKALSTGRNLDSAPLAGCVLSSSLAPTLISPLLRSLATQPPARGILLPRAELAPSPTPHSISHPAFNTHSHTRGPRFSPTDF